MVKEMYKQLVAEYMRRESELKIQLEELELKASQQEQNFYFDMRNKQMEVVQLTVENAELKDELMNQSQFPETDGYEVGSPSDYEEDKQLNLFND